MKLKIIPNTRGFLASDCGKVFNSEGIERNYYRNKDGYKTVSVITSDGIRITYGVHRLVALTFLIIPGDPNLLTVNHRDMDLDNNASSNLEWVTVKENNQHAAIMKYSKFPKVLATDPNGELVFFNSLISASEVIGVPPIELWDYVRSGNTINGWKLKHHGSKDKIPDSLKSDKIKLRDELGRQPSKSVKVRDFDTKEIFFFDTLSAAGDFLNTSPSHIHHSIQRNDEFKLLKKRYQIAYSEDIFIEPTDSQIDSAINLGSKEVLAYNRENNLLLVAVSASFFIKEYGLSKKAVTTLLKSDKIREVKGWIFLYNSENNLKRIKKFIESPDS